MTPLSAVDAIEPAWRHAWRLLVTRRKWGTLFKIATVAFFAEVGGCNANFNSSGAGGHTPTLPPSVIAAIAAVAVVAVIIAVAVGLAFFYLGSRLQLVLLDIVLRGDTTVGPIWRRFGGLTWRWIGLKLLFLLAFLVACIPVLIPVLIHITRTMPTGSGGAHGQLGSFLAFFLALMATVVLLILLYSVCYLLLRDFGIPSLVLENTSMRETLRRIVHFVRVEPGQILLYLVMRFVLGIAAAIVAYMAILIGMLLLLIPLGGIAALFYAVLHKGSTGAHAVMVTGWVLCGTVLAVILIVAVITLFGFLAVFQQSYALYFLGGRYPMIGAWLESSMPPVLAFAGQPMYAPAPYTSQPPAEPERPF